MSILMSNRLRRILLAADPLPPDLEQSRLSFISSWAKLLDHNYDSAIAILRKIIAEYPHKFGRQEQLDRSHLAIDISVAKSRLIKPMEWAANEATYRMPLILLECEFYNKPYHIGSSQIDEWHQSADVYLDAGQIREYLTETLCAYECPECGSMCADGDVREVDSRLICETCCDENYTWSEYEELYISNDDVREALDENGERVRISRHNENFRFDARLDEYVHEDYGSDSDDDDGVISGYHSSRALVRLQHDTWTAKHMRFIGVELEVECGDESRSACAKAVNDVVNKEGRMMFFENDGSLSHGFEMITQPLSLPAHRELFKFLTQPGLTKGMRSHATSTCGLHVHVSRSGLTPLQIQKIVAFVNSPDNEWFIRALARRYSTGYCNIKEKKIGNGIHTSFDRYEAVNLTNSKTIEFRIFRGSLKYEAVIAAIEFCHAVIEFCRPAVTSVNQLSAGSFLTFCATNMADETKILRSYVTSRLRGRAGANAEAA